MNNEIHNSNLAELNKEVENLIDNLPQNQKKLIQLIQQKYSLNSAVLKAFAQTPREFFISSGLRHKAYQDFAISIGDGQTISQPSLVAKITDIAIHKRELPLANVLEIGTGSGFQAAILAKIAKRVYSTERIKTLIQKAKQTIRSLSIKNIYLFDDSKADFEIIKSNRYDAIIFSAGFSGDIPDIWLNLLAPQGVLVFPYRQTNANDSIYKLTSLIRIKDNQFKSKIHQSVSFVPYIESNLK